MSRKATQLLTTTIPVGIVRTQLGKILTRIASNRERVVVTKKGQAAVVMLSIEDFLQSIVHTPAELAAVQKAARKSRADKLTIPAIEAEIAAVRQARTPKAA
jgi:PHD/YefM family antitoxin component YafN of YafNO toxin-antitoxin module